MNNLADSYSLGKFSTIKYPLPEWNGETDGDWVRHMMTQGYKMRWPDVDGFRVWALDPDRDHDWPYAVELELDSNRLVFMKKWYDVTHFLTNHGLGHYMALIAEIMLSMQEPNYE